MLLLSFPYYIYNCHTAFINVTLFLYFFLLPCFYYCHAVVIYNFHIDFIFLCCFYFLHQIYDLRTIFIRNMVEMIAYSKNRELLQWHLKTLTFNIRSWHINKLKRSPHIWKNNGLGGDTRHIHIHTEGLSVSII